MNNVALLLKQVDPCQVPSEWVEIERLLDYGREYWEEYYTLSQVKDLLLNGALQFWHLREDGEDEPHLGAMLQIDTYGKKKVLRVLWIGGKRFGDMMDFLWVLVLWAVKLGCDDIEVSGRSGFERLLKGYGFERTHVVLRKRLAGISGEEH